MIPFPPLIDGTNVRRALGAAQLADPSCSAAIWQKRQALDPTFSKRAGLQRTAVFLVKPVEAAEYRLSPDDDLLERQVTLAPCCLWVSLLPDLPVPHEPAQITRRRWLSQHCHATFINPLRPVGPSFQLLRRCGYVGFAHRRL